jgi:D-beta-D-heptose 7-phosphate kinase / D-beta-D-heptose 1-phosphate adenosyltransferase
VTLSIPDFSGLRILVAGDAMLDEYWFGDTVRISPEAPVPVVHTRSAEQRPGGAANVAVNVAALGADVTLAAMVGADTRADALQALLESGQVRCAFHRVADVPTVHKLRVLARNQQMLRVDAEHGFAGFAAEFAAVFDSQLATAQAVILSDYGKGTLAAVEDLIQRCQAAALPVLIDPKGTDFSRYRGATVLTPNQLEFQAVVGTWPDEEGFLRKAEELRAALDLQALLVTRGERGMTLVPRGEPPLTLPAHAREVFDVTGAGDTVVAVMAAATGLGVAVEDAAALANLAAGLVVAKIGAATVTTAELRLALHRRGRGGRGLVDADELVALVQGAQTRGERVVMTNGVFDILHAGHVSYLEEAKSLGDRLVVAVNDDASTMRLKGPKRPMNELADRMAVLAGLAAVDWVVPFSEDTPAELIGRVLPDVLVKGGDYRVEQIAGGEAVIRNGGEVRVLGFKPGRSTSALIDSLRDQ